MSNGSKRNSSSWTFKPVIDRFSFPKQPSNRIDVQSFRQDPSCDTSFIDFSGLRIVELADKRKQLSGSFHLQQNIDGENFSVESFLVRVEEDDEDIFISSHYVRLCTDALIFDWHMTNVEPRVSGCPLPNGTYVVSDFNLKNITLLYLPRKKFYVKVDLYRNRYRICNATIDFNIINAD